VKKEGGSCTLPLVFLLIELYAVARALQRRGLEKEGMSRGSER